MQLSDAIFIFELNRHRMECTGLWDIKGSEGYTLPSKIDQMKVSHETGSEANFGFRHALMPS